MSEAVVPADRPRALAFLPRFLFDGGRGAAAYVLKAWLLVLLPSVALAFAVDALAPQQDGPFAGAEQIPPAFMFILLVGVGPFLETLIMAVVATVLNRMGGLTLAAFGNALLWGLAHSFAAPLWGLVVWWPFLILTIAFLTWRPRGLWFAIGVATTIHALQNAVAGAGLVFG